MIAFDAETGPLPDDELAARIPEFEPPAAPGEFTLESAKIPKNWKDPDKISARITEARVAHQHKVNAYSSTVKTARETWMETARDKAALSPYLGRVLAIGYMSVDPAGEADWEYVQDVDPDPDGEAGLLSRFWDQCAKASDNNEKMAGWGIFNFDLPFFIKRSFFLDVPVPSFIWDRHRYIQQWLFIDLMLIWLAGHPLTKSQGINHPNKLDTAARLCGLGGKPDGVHGGMYAGMLETDPEAAAQYLRNDVDMTARLARRLLGQ